VADLAGRVRLIERKLNWMMDTMRMKVAISSGVLGPDGQPIPSKVVDGTMNEIFALTRVMPQALESDGIDPPPIEDAGNGN
jgi:hypothetical protein